MLSIYLSVFLVIFNNFQLGPVFLLTDVLYTALGIYFLFQLKSFRISTFYKPLLFLSLFITIILVNYVLFQNISSVFSQIRFLWGMVIFWILYLFFDQKQSKKELLFKAYLVFCVYCSGFVIFQIFAFYILQTNIYITFGEFDDLRNSMEGAISGLQSARVGGFFREPSWYAIFVGPSLYILNELKNYRGLVIVGFGLLLSSSTYAILIVSVFLLSSVFFSTYAKSKVNALVTLLLIPPIIYVILSYAPFLFDRLFFIVENQGGGSYLTRILNPFSYFYENISFFGVDVSFLKGDDFVFFVNTFLYVFYSFGIIGTLAFLSLIISHRIKYIFLSFSLMLAISIEGMAGRIDFWIVLLIYQSIYNGGLSSLIRNQRD